MAGGYPVDRTQSFIYMCLMCGHIHIPKQPLLPPFCGIHQSKHFQNLKHFQMAIKSFPTALYNSCPLPHPKCLGLFTAVTPFFFFLNLRIVAEFSSGSQIFKSLVLITLPLLNLVKSGHNFSCCVKVLAILILLLAPEQFWRASESSIS